MKLNNIKLNSDISFFRYHKIGSKYLLTNIIGDYLYLSPSQFTCFINGKLKKNEDLYRNLKQKGFINDRSITKKIIKSYREKKNFLFEGPSLHIIVVTLNCNYRCIYCQASSRYWKEKGFDKFNMDESLAKKVVDVIFSSPSKGLTIEFQGGEPLVNWPIIKFIIEYAEKKNKKAKKDLLISVVTNLSLMTDEIYNYCKEHMISLCTSLDGPKKIHNLNRPYPDQDSYEATTSWIKKIKEEEKKNSNVYYLNALLTVSKRSLRYPKEIIDEYLKYGFTGIHLRPLSNLGFSQLHYDLIGYSVKEFFDFWKKSMDYIISLNKKRIFFYERGTAIILQKIFNKNDPNFVDLRSPCGAGIGQMLYNYNGDVYTCDEGRMIGDDTFLLGNVKRDNYTTLISCDKIKAVCQSSTLENLSCDTCIYQPYCGVCPVSNYALYGDLFAPQINNYWCQLHKMMFDYIFTKLQDPQLVDIFKIWIGLKPIKNFKNIPTKRRIN